MRERELRVGLVAFATKTGLGYQTRALYRNLEPAKTLLIDMSTIKGMPLQRDWYGPEAVVTDVTPTDEQVDRFLDDLDVVMVAETPLNYRLFNEAHERGIATVLQYNYEFCEHLPSEHLPLPTIFAAPTSWGIEVMRERFGDRVRHLPVPVESAGLPARLVSGVHTFFHIAGTPTVGDRNGTLDYVEAVRRCDAIDDTRFLLYCQAPNPAIRAVVAGTSIELIGAVDEPGDLYAEGDILVLPRRYGGLCLVANEAIASGVPVLMPDISPNNTWLPPEWLVPAQLIARSRAVYPPAPFDMHKVDVDALATRMCELARSDALVGAMAWQARVLADQSTWDVLRPRYRDLLAHAVEVETGVLLNRFPTTKAGGFQARTAPVHSPEGREPSVSRRQHLRGPVLPRPGSPWRRSCPGPA